MNDIVVKDLYKSYNTGTEELTILSGVNLEIEQNTRVILTGNSGCGKSTLLNLISGMDSFSKGEIFVDGHIINNLTESELSSYRAKSIGLIFQFHYLLKDFTALENVMLPAFMTGKDRNIATEKAKDLLVEIGLEDRLDHMPSQLSGGERQRIAVVRSLINDPGIILADEPTGNLDENNSRKVEDLLFELVKNHGKTLLLVTHDSALARRGDRHIEIHEGKLQEI
ncbi:MAG: ABC transporter ATP-binding protein [Spirochaetales bacterium]|nr:ABC transporter ATP-binding protein [Spirochaetales bacterium]